MLITNNAMNDNIISYSRRYFLNLFFVKRKFTGCNNKVIINTIFILVTMTLINLYNSILCHGMEWF